MSGAPAGEGPRPVPPRGCELCEAAPLTTRYHEDELCWIADCEACGVPMVVWKRHGSRPADDERERMVAALRLVALARFGDPDGFWIDEVMRQIPDHFHAHARTAWWASRSAGSSTA